MTQEEKSILLQDLCARLPYTLYVRVEEFNVPKDEAITEGLVGNYLKDDRCNDYDAEGLLNELADDCINVKPYLRPMSSMTEKEKEKYDKLFTIHSQGETYCENWEWMDFMNSHHFDYRGLIEKGLALEAPKDMYK